MPSSMKRSAPNDESKAYAKFSKELGLYIQLIMLGDRVVDVKLSSKAPKDLDGKNHPYLERIIDHIKNGKEDLRDIPIDFEGTEFERDVLEALREVRPGEVITYGGLAEKAGRPNAARAVGQICAKNPFAILVPCHRVLPATGGIGKYSSDGGPPIKRKLLEKEGALE